MATSFSKSSRPYKESLSLNNASNNKSDSNLSENKRLKFVDYIISDGFITTIEHIMGGNNILANKLSRLIKEAHELSTCDDSIGDC